MSALNPVAPVVRFLPYQRAWIADDSRFKIGMFSRQTGKTFSTCGECVDACFTAWKDDRRTRWVILSRGERQAAEAMTEVIKPFTRAFYEVYNTLVKGGEAHRHPADGRDRAQPAAAAHHGARASARRGGSARSGRLPRPLRGGRGFFCDGGDGMMRQAATVGRGAALMGEGLGSVTGAALRGGAVLAGYAGTVSLIAGAFLRPAAEFERFGWRSHPTFARRRSGRGGGWEYHWQLFPLAAQKKLLAHAKSAEPVAPAVAADRDEAWTWYESLPQSVKDKALLRLRVIQQVEALEGNLGRYLAVDQVARLSKCGERTIWNWLDRIEGIRRDDRLPYLAPRHRAAQPRIRTKQCDAEFMDLLKSDFLRLSGPSFASCYRRQLRVAQERGLQTLPPKTAQRRLNATVSPMTQLLARKGIEAVKRRYPTQRRDKTALHALEAVNADFHKFDVFVRWPAERGVPSFVGRPQMVAFQDIYSGRILSWRLDQTPNSTAVLLAAGDMIEDWGIPGHVLLDNGREFAAKVVTGGAATRYRFKVKEDDVPGLFVALGCEIHWATPYSGQSKPIERAFRDMCDTIAKDPRFDGAWTGNRRRRADRPPATR